MCLFSLRTFFCDLLCFCFGFVLFCSTCILVYPHLIHDLSFTEFSMVFATHRHKALKLVAVFGW